MPASSPEVAPPRSAGLAALLASWWRSRTAPPLPAPAAAAPLATAEGALPAPAAAPPRRVLLVDDTDMNRHLARILLQRLGWEVQEAHDGAAALAALEQQQFALVLMDCMMPHMDGYEATRRWRAFEAAHGLRRTPVVALTASTIEGERARCVAAGADDYLSKPYTAAELSAILHRYAQAQMRHFHKGNKK